MGWQILCNEMVDRQLSFRGIKDENILEVFRKVPRHEFVLPEYKDSAYGDYPLPIGNGQTISQPYMVAIMTELLQPKNIDVVLEIGTGSGYQTAILSMLSKKVYSIERFPDLAKNAQAVLEKLGFKNVDIKTGDGTCGWVDYAPFDKIIITAGTPNVPQLLFEQLKDPGSLIAPVGSAITQILTLYKKKNGKIGSSESISCIFVPLVGNCATRMKDDWQS